MNELLRYRPSSVSASRSWIGGEAETSARLRLFALPFAGGNAASYGQWHLHLPAWIAFSPVHLPGRERRLMEPPLDDIRPLLAQLVAAIEPWLDRPFVLFGHSMGAILAYELSAALHARGLPAPDLLIVSGHGAPNLPRRFRTISHLPDAAFVAAVMELGGLPQALLDEGELLSLVLPALRADFRLCESYTWLARQPLPCPIMALGGHADPIAGPAELESWRAMTSRSLTCERFEGDHFFINQSTAAVVAHIVRGIAECSRDGRDGRARMLSERLPS